MNMGNDSGTREHRARGRGRKAFWVLIAATLAIALVFTRPGRHGDHGSGGDWSVLDDRSIEAAMSAIDATEEQRARLEPEIQRARIALQDLALAEQELHLQMLSALRSGEPNAAAISELRARAVALSESAIDTAFDSGLAIWSELEADQRAELLSRWQTRGHRSRSR